jgi:hypothetical protein
MADKPSTIRVKPIPGELGRFEVASASGGKPYLVDLFLHNGHGQCSCTDWGTRVNPNIKANPKAWIPYKGWNGKPDPLRSECRHISGARRYFLREILQGFARSHRTAESDRHG